MHPFVSLIHAITKQGTAARDLGIYKSVNEKFVIKNLNFSNNNTNQTPNLTKITWQINIGGEQTENRRRKFRLQLGESETVGQI
jgi:hypothetical protein